MFEVLIELRVYVQQCIEEFQAFPNFAVDYMQFKQL